MAGVNVGGNVPRFLHGLKYPTGKICNGFAKRRVERVRDACLIHYTCRHTHLEEPAARISPSPLMMFAENAISALGLVRRLNPHFERDVLGNRNPSLQAAVDATAMVQAGIGVGYSQQFIATEINDFVLRSEAIPVPAVTLFVRIAFNPSVSTAWCTAVMGIINSITMLAIILSVPRSYASASMARWDHLLVMPLTPFEIAMSNIWPMPW
jgi:hypothetical protein